MAIQITMNRKTKCKNTNCVQIGTWNIQAWNTSKQEILVELKKHEADTCTMQETTKQETF